MKFFTNTKNWVIAHKKTSAAIVIVILVLGYVVERNVNKASAQTRYVLSTVTKGSIISTVSGTGKVSASNQVDVTSKASGDLVYLNAKVGQVVKTGDLLAQTDSTDAAFELESSKISYDQLLNSDTNKSRDTQDALDQANIDLVQSYQTGRTTMASASIDMSSVLSGLKTLVYGYLAKAKDTGLDNRSLDNVNTAENSYFTANDAVNSFSQSYRSLTINSDSATVESLLISSNHAAVSVAQAAKDVKDAVEYIRNQQNNANDTAANTASTNANNYVSTANGTVSSTLSAETTIVNDKKNLQDKQSDVTDLTSGNNSTDVRSGALDLRQKQQAYDDHFVRAPFDGIIAAVPVLKGDSINSGATIATLITQQKIAEITLNEIDVAKIKTGEKATLTFDAIDGLSITGQVSEIDLVGTLSQGVVSYNVKISFDVDDDRIKPGMTVSADIITDMKNDVLVVPNSAIKSQGGSSYVQMFDQAPSVTPGASAVQGVTSTVPPKQVPVEVGVSNDTQTEITSGLAEGDTIVSRTITQTSTTAAAAPSLFGGGGGALRGGAAGGAARPVTTGR